MWICEEFCENVDNDAKTSPHPPRRLRILFRVRCAELQVLRNRRDDDQKNARDQLSKGQFLERLRTHHTMVLRKKVQQICFDDLLDQALLAGGNQAGAKAVWDRLKARPDTHITEEAGVEYITRQAPREVVWGRGQSWSRAISKPGRR